MKLFAIYITNNPTAYGGAQPLKHHTAGRDHRKYLLLFIFGNELILDTWLED